MRLIKKFSRRALMRWSVGAVAVAATFGEQPAMAQDVTEAIAEAAGIPQMDAFLQYKYDVAETEALPIDGVWMISSIRKRIRIEKGRAYAVDPWLHMFTLKVQQDMVVLKDFTRTGAGQYTANDLPLMGPATMHLGADGNLRVSVKGMLAPVSYTLIKREPADASAFSMELAALSGGGSPVRDPAPVAPPSDDAPPAEIAPPADGDPTPDCKEYGLDEAGKIVCQD